MKYILLLFILLGTSHSLFAEQGYPDTDIRNYRGDTYQQNNLLQKDSSLIISVTGQGVAPSFATSHAQSYALAKRAAVADAYRLISEKVKGIRVEGQNLIEIMMEKRSTIRTS